MRQFLPSTGFIRGLKSVVKVSTDPRKVASFERNFPTPQKAKKPWDERGLTKDQFFGEKYRQKSPELQRILDEKVERQRRLRGLKKQHEAEKDGKKSSNIRPLFQKLRSPMKTIRQNPVFEYIFGTHSVKAAMRAKKRDTFGTLYIQNGTHESQIDKEILSRAKSIRLTMQWVDKRTMNELCGHGVHNSLVLEVKPLQFPMISELGECNGETGEYNLTLQDSSDPDAEAESIGLLVQRTSIGEKKYPVGLYLDGVTDPQNTGAIIRSAYFLGVDFIIVPKDSSARLGPFAHKASTGALEYLPVFKNEVGLKLFDKCKESEWVVVSTTPPLESKNRSSEGGLAAQKSINKRDLSTLAKESPVLLVLGSEGAGLRKNLIHRSDYVVGITNNRASGTEMVDSLNVSVATAILLEELVR